MHYIAFSETGVVLNVFSAGGYHVLIYKQLILICLLSHFAYAGRITSCSVI